MNALHRKVIICANPEDAPPSSKLRDLPIFPDFSSGEYGSKFKDILGADNFAVLSSGVFWWLLNIQPGHLVYHQDTKCHIEPYTPSHFARQFGYSQLYVGNPNKNLAYEGNLYEGARGWFHFVASGTETEFLLPQKSPELAMTLNF